MALENEVLTQGIGNAAAGSLLAIILGALVVFLIIGIVVWIYSSLAFMAMARKDKQSSPGLAWIPLIGPMIVAFRASGMHWWPWLLFIGVFIPFVNIAADIALVVMFTIWQWKLFEAIDKPGWWSILCLISPLNLIFWGIAAWSK